jgi:hypothetical protein
MGRSKRGIMGLSPCMPLPSLAVLRAHCNQQQAPLPRGPNFAARLVGVHELSSNEVC